MTTNEIATAQKTDWAELGRAIARRMADKWGAEWQAHYWELVEDEDPDYAAACPELRALYDADEWEECDRRKDLCRDAWRAELAKLLHIKRNTGFLHEVWSPDTDSLRPLNLQLPNMATIQGTVRVDEEGRHLFDFRISRSADSTILLPDDAEFAPHPSAKLPNLRTDYLYLLHESGGYRHYLGRRDVHCGYGLTLVLQGGVTIRGRYECNLTRDDCIPLFYFDIAGDLDGTERVIRIPDDAGFLIEGRAL